LRKLKKLSKSSFRSNN